MTIDPSTVTTAVSQNPFAVMTFIAAPAILTNASSILTLSTSTRLMRCLDRINQLTEKIDSGELSLELRQTYFKQIQLSHRQSRQFLVALRAIYATLASFAIASFMAIIGAAIASFSPHSVIEGFGIASLVAGGFGVFGFVWSSINLIKASRITLVIMQEDMQHLARHKALLP